MLLKRIFQKSGIITCFYHLLQAMYRKIQKLALQVAYNDPDNRGVKNFVHLTGALAIFPVGDFRRLFTILKAAAAANMSDFMKYFEETYVSSEPAAERRRAVASQYLPRMWNQYMSTLADHSRANNVSKGWYHRFRLVAEEIIPTFIQSSKISGKNEVTLK